MATSKQRSYIPRRNIEYRIVDRSQNRRLKHVQAKETPSSGTTKSFYTCYTLWKHNPSCMTGGNLTTQIRNRSITGQFYPVMCISLLVNNILNHSQFAGQVISQNFTMSNILWYCRVAAAIWSYVSSAFKDNSTSFLRYRIICYSWYSGTWELGTPKGLSKTVLNSEVVLFLRSISMWWIDLGTEVAVLKSKVVPISQVVLKTGFTVHV